MTKTPEVCVNCCFSVVSNEKLYCVEGFNNPLEVEPEGTCGTFMCYEDPGDISEQSGALE